MAVEADVSAPVAGRTGATMVYAWVATVVSFMVMVGTGFDLRYPGRSLITVAFVVVIGGWAPVSFVGFSDRLVEFVAGICVSISVGILLAMSQVALAAWHPEAVVAGWAGVTTIMAFVRACLAGPRARMRSTRAGK